MRADAIFVALAALALGPLCAADPAPAPPASASLPAVATSVASLPHADASPAAELDVSPWQDGAGRTARIHRTDHFVLVYWSGENDPRAAQLAEMVERLHDRFLLAVRRSGLPAAHPANRLVWLCFDSRAEFDRYSRQADLMDLSWLEGYYSARTNRVAILWPAGRAESAPASPPAGSSGRPSGSAGEGGIVAMTPASQPDAATLPLCGALHEAAHQLSFNCGLLKRGVMYPLWVSEGLAMRFETAAIGDAGDEENLPRLRQIVAMREGEELAELAQLVAVTRVEGELSQTPAQIYAQAWRLFGFLEQSRPRQLADYLSALRALPPGRRSPARLRAEFESAFGPLDRLEPHWRAHLEGLHLPGDGGAASPVGGR